MFSLRRVFHIIKSLLMSHYGLLKIFVGQACWLAGKITININKTVDLIVCYCPIRKYLDSEAGPIQEDR